MLLVNFSTGCLFSVGASDETYRVPFMAPQEGQMQHLSPIGSTGGEANCFHKELKVWSQSIRIDSKLTTVSLSLVLGPRKWKRVIGRFIVSPLALYRRTTPSQTIVGSQQRTRPFACRSAVAMRIIALGHGCRGEKKQRADLRWLSPQATLTGWHPGAATQTYSAP